MVNDIFVGLRIPAELKDKIQADAIKKDRPAGYIIREILTNYYDGLAE